MFVRSLLNFLVVLTVTLRSLLPVGFMLAPSQAGNGKMTVVICTGHGPETTTLDADGKQVPAKPPQSDTGVCAYASTGPVALDDGAPAKLEHQGRYAVVAYRIPSDLFSASPRPGATSARGPPPTSI